MELLRLLSRNEIIAQVISFLILLFLLRIFLWKNVLAVLDKRKERIDSDLKKISEAKEEAIRIKEQYEEKLNLIEQEADRKIQEALALGRQITDDVRKKAHQEAQEILEAAQASIKYELSKAKEELKEKVIDLTLRATENIIEEKFTEESDKKLIKNFLDRIEEIK